MNRRIQDVLNDQAIRERSDDGFIHCIVQLEMLRISPRMSGFTSSMAPIFRPGNFQGTLLHAGRRTKDQAPSTFRSGRRRRSRRYHRPFLKPLLWDGPLDMTGRYSFSKRTKLDPGVLSKDDIRSIRCRGDEYL